MHLPAFHHHTPLGAALQPWADLSWCLLTLCVWGSTVMSGGCRAPPCALGWTLHPWRGSGIPVVLWHCPLCLPTPSPQCP